MILVGQLAIIYLGGEFFNVVPLEFDDLLKIITATSSVMIIGEIIRLVRNRIKNTGSRELSAD